MDGWDRYARMDVFETGGAFSENCTGEIVNGDISGARPMRRRSDLNLEVVPRKDFGLNTTECDCAWCPGACTRKTTRIEKRSTIDVHDGPSLRTSERRLNFNDGGTDVLCMEIG